MEFKTIRLKVVKCPSCYRKTEVNQDIIMTICKNCQTEMIKFIEGGEKQKF